MPIDTAYVEIRPETGGFGAELKRELDQAFRQIERVVKSSMDGVTHTFEKSGEEIEDTFKETSRAAKREYDKVEKEAKQSTKQSSGHFKGLFSVLAGGFLAIGAVNVFGGFLKDARESIKIGRLTAQVIESTGGAAGISAKEVSKLATAISNKTGIDDEAIQSGENLLLTFTNVRNEVGKGNDIFNQATLTIQDMSVALGQDTKSSAIQLGKALNDPIKGVTALQRVGVSFTESQKEQIKVLVESGDVMGAQKIILQELTTEFGGAAEAAATPWDRLKVTLGNIGEQIGTALIPVLDSAATWLADKLPGAIKTVSDFFNNTLAPAVDAVVAGFKDEDGDLAGFNGFMEDLGGFAKTTFDTFKNDVLPPLKEFGNFLKDTVVPAVEDFFEWMKDPENRNAVLTFAGVVATAAVAMRGLALAMALVDILAFANPLGLVVLGIAALSAALVWAYFKFEAFRDIADSVGRLLSTSFQVALWLITDSFTAIKIVVQTGLSFLVAKLLQFGSDMLTTANKAFGWIPGIGPLLRVATNKFEDFRDDVNDALDGVTDQKVFLSIAAQSNASILATAQSRGQAATGGPITGPGTGTSDTAGLWALSNGEHVLTAKEVQAMGGHAEVVRFRKSIVGGLARGGPAQLNVVPSFPNPAYYATETEAFMGNALTIWSKAQRDAIQRVLAQALGNTGISPSGYAFPLPRGSYRVGMPFGGYPGHGGQDFPAPRGTPVYAPFSGMFTPIRLGNRSYGNYANLMAGAVRFIGAHLQGFARGAGQVLRGTKLGYVDSTGNSTGDHLHAEFRLNGHAVNPNRFLRFGIGGLVDSTGLGLLHSGEAVVNPAFPSRARDILSRVGLGGGAPIVFNQTITFEGAVPTQEQAAAVGRSLGKGVMEILERHDALQAGRFA